MPWMFLVEDNTLVASYDFRNSASAGRSWFADRLFAELVYRI
jgi:hypothetical protein